MKKSIKTILGATILTGLSGTLLGAPVPELITAGTAAGGISAGLAPYISDERQMTLKDTVILLLPTLGSALTLGLTHGWGHALLGLLAGPIASIIRTSLNEKEEGVFYH